MKHSFKIILLLTWPLFLNDFYLIVLARNHLGLLWTLDVVFFFLVPTVTLVFLIRCGQVSLAEIGIGRPPTPLSIIAGIGLCVILFFFVPAIYSYSRGLMPWRLFTGYDFPRQQPLRSITMAYAALSAGLLEEIVYRGVVISQLRRHVRSGALVVFYSCAIFSGIHWGEGPAKMVVTFVWAIVPAVWFLKSRDLWGLVTCHSLYLFFSFGMYRSWQLTLW